MLAINKPAGYLVQGDKTSDTPIIELAKEYVKRKYDKPGNVFLGLAHRLDRPVSGVLLLARTSKALTRLNKMFAAHQITKDYMAVVNAFPPRDQGEIRQWLLKDRRKNRVSFYKKKKEGAKLAETNYRVMTTLEPYHLIHLQPRTGRAHQLRVALSSLGTPIVGDVKYGGDKYDPGFIFLHCSSLSFTHPVGGKAMEIRAPLPPDPLWQSFADFRT